MKTLTKSLFGACLISAASQIFAAQVRCPAADLVALNSARIDAVQYIGYDHFAVMTGTESLENSFYDSESNRYWRLFAVVGVEAQPPGFNEGYLQGTKLVHDVTTNVNRYADMDANIYFCTYGRGSVEYKVAAFSVINDNQTNSQLIKRLALHFK